MFTTYTDTYSKAIRTSYLGIVQESFRIISLSLMQLLSGIGTPKFWYKQNLKETAGAAKSRRDATAASFEPLLKWYVACNIMCRRVMPSFKQKKDFSNNSAYTNSLLTQVSKKVQPLSKPNHCWWWAGLAARFTRDAACCVRSFCPPKRKLLHIFVSRVQEEAFRILQRWTAVQKNKGFYIQDGYFHYL